MVIQGRRYVSASLAELLVNDLDVDAQQPIHSQLSEREFQIFCKIAVGKSSRTSPRNCASRSRPSAPIAAGFSRK
ncbi:MAG: hypothetical protein WDM77_03190 [Steroidobacteraceae bacterium]